MTAPACSDQEFMELWKQLGCSTTALAKHLGVAVNNVRARRRRIENRYKVVLPTIDVAGRKKYDQSAYVSADRVEVKLNIKDGVVLVAGDQHFWPESVPVMHRAYVYLSKKLKPFAQIWNGDALDGSSISRFQDIGWEDKPTVFQELEAVKDRANEVIKASPNSKRVWNAGNHDLRFESRIANTIPQYRDIHGMHLKDHVPEFLPAWFTTINEGATSHTEIRHREKGGIHASYRNTVESGVTLVTGHDHRADVVPFDDRRGRRYGVRHGMTADSSRDGQFVNYLEARKANWQSAIAVLTYKDGVLLYPELALRWDDDSFQFRGEIIKV